MNNMVKMKKKEEQRGRKDENPIEVYDYLGRERRKSPGVKHM